LETSAVLLTRLAEDLKPFQRFTTAVGGFAERMLDRAAREVYQAHPWSMTIGSFVLPTVDGTYSYSIPDSVTDFDGFPQEERVTSYWAYDQPSLSRVPDSATGQKFPFTFDRGASLINFPYNPGTGDKTVYYRKQYGGLTTFSTWPDKYEDIVLERASFQCLHRSVGQDARAKAPEFFNNSERMIKEAWIHDRQGQTLQEGRDPQGVLGDAIYYGFNE
jgi:hypothetical protein